MKKYAVLLSLLILASFIIIGCGETLTGIGKDVRRVGKGVKTIFIKEAQ